ncbi:Uncharacterized protein Adt_44046 [Abeliophyllum distichum]|uniref:Uncharacterized protein n=1 Tax=Abeliophyllum distichum TaxID=126358 RepID=A0ABD1P9R0_9LAMI
MQTSETLNSLQKIIKTFLPQVIGLSSRAEKYLNFLNPARSGTGRYVAWHLTVTRSRRNYQAITATATGPQAYLSYRVNSNMVSGIQGALRLQDRKPVGNANVQRYQAS